MSYDLINLKNNFRLWKIYWMFNVWNYDLLLIRKELQYRLALQAKYFFNKNTNQSIKACNIISYSSLNVSKQYILYSYSNKRI